jgi:hypothetical protein
MPFIGAANEFGTLGMGQYTDIAALIKYGMRVDMPIYNPNASILEAKATPFLFAALELTDNNSMTRTMTATMNVDRRMRTGRLYFVARESLDQKVGMAPGKTDTKPTKIKGYIGFLTDCSLDYQHASMPTYNLTFQRVRKAVLLQFTDKNGKIRYVANFRMLPDINGVIEALETASKSGTLDPDVFGTPIPGNVVGPADIMQVADPDSLDVGSRFYAARFKLHSKYPHPEYLNLFGVPKQKPYLRTSDPTANTSVNYVWENKFVSTSPWVSHHTFMPPNDGNTDRRGVIRVDDSSPGLNQDLVDRLGLIDLRLRALNFALFSERVRPNDVLHPMSQDLTDRLQMKRSMFKAIYVPSYSMNAFYRIAGLRGLAVSLVNTRDYTKSVQEGPGKPLTPADLQNVFPQAPWEFFALAGDFVVQAGAPFRLDANSYFAILRYVPDGSLQLGTSKLLTSPAEIQTNLDNIKSVVYGYTKGAISKDDVQRVYDSFSPDSEDAVYLPVVFHGPIDPDRFLEHIDPGIPLSLYDIGYNNRQVLSMWSFSFPGHSALSDPEPGNEQLQHTAGGGIDLSLFPYWAKTGITLRRCNDYVLSTSYTALPQHTHPDLYSGKFLGTVGFVETVANSTLTSFKTATGQTVQEEIPIDILTNSMAVIPKNGATDVAKTNEIFSQIIIGPPDLSGIFKLEDLEENDRIFHHVGVGG